MEGSGIIPVVTHFTPIPRNLLLPVRRRMMIILSLTYYALGSSPALGTLQGPGSFVVCTVGLFTNMILGQNKLK